jgi:hypothetical protein
MATDNSAKKQGIARSAQKKHYCPCGLTTKAIQIMPGRLIRYECDAKHRHPRKAVTLR